MEHFDPEEVDLLELSGALREALGPAVVGAVVGRTELRDEVVRRLGCSLLQGEQIVDTMVSRGFLKRHQDESGTMTWLIRESEIPGTSNRIARREFRGS